MFCIVCFQNRCCVASLTGTYFLSSQIINGMDIISSFFVYKTLIVSGKTFICKQILLLSFRVLLKLLGANGNLLCIQSNRNVGKLHVFNLEFILWKAVVDLL